MGTTPIPMWRLTIERDLEKKERRGEEGAWKHAVSERDFQKGRDDLFYGWGWSYIEAT